MMFSVCLQVFITLRICNIMCHSDPLTAGCFSLVPGAGCLRWLARTSAKLQFARQMHRPKLSVSKNRGPPKSSILIGCSIVNHPFWGTSIFGNTHSKICVEFVEFKILCGFFPWLVNDGDGILPKAMSKNCSFWRSCLWCLLIGSSSSQLGEIRWEQSQSQSSQNRK